jgi:hypothetical protein
MPDLKVENILKRCNICMARIFMMGSIVKREKPCNFLQGLIPQ